jgi:hypothetical protein
VERLSEKASRLEELADAYRRSDPKTSAERLAAAADIRALLSEITTLRGRVDLAVGALDRLCGLAYPSREEHDSAWAYAQETLSKLKPDFFAESAKFLSKLKEGEG